MSETLMLTEYAYGVKFVADYYVISTDIYLMLDEYTGNLSDEARELAIKEAENYFKSELNLDVKYCDVEVTLKGNYEDIVL